MIQDIVIATMEYE